MASSWIDEKSEKTAEAILPQAITDINIGADGKASWDAFSSMRNMVPILNSLVSVHPDIASDEKLKMVRDSLIEIKKGDKQTAAAFLTVMEAKSKNILKNKKQKYFMSTTISIQRHRANKEISFEDDGIICKILANRPENIGTGDFKLTGIGAVRSSMPPTYSALVTEVLARTHSQAWKKSLQYSDFFIGVINFWANWGKQSLLQINNAEPGNSFRTGPYLTLHSSDGTLIENQSRYVIEYHEEKSPKGMSFIPEGRWNLIEETFRKIKTHRQSEMLREAFSRYNDALNHRDHHVSLFKLWGVLEHVTFSIRGDAKTSIKRATFIFSDYRELRTILDFVSKVRNRYVHAGVEEAAILHAVEKIRLVLEQYIQTILFVKIFDVPKNDLIYILDAPNDAQQIRKQLAISRKILRFLTPPKDDGE